MALPDTRALMQGIVVDNRARYGRGAQDTEAARMAALAAAGPGNTQAADIVGRLAALHATRAGAARDRYGDLLTPQEQMMLDRVAGIDTSAQGALTQGAADIEHTKRLEDLQTWYDTQLEKNRLAPSYSGGGGGGGGGRRSSGGSRSSASAPAYIPPPATTIADTLRDLFGAPTPAPTQPRRSTATTRSSTVRPQPSRTRVIRT